MKRRGTSFQLFLLTVLLCASVCRQLYAQAEGGGSGPGTPAVGGGAIMDFGSNAAGAIPFAAEVRASTAGQRALTTAQWSRAVDTLAVQQDRGWAQVSRDAARAQAAASAWSSSDPSWQGFSSTTSVLTPVPEPSAYGAILLAGAALWVVYQRRRKGTASGKLKTES
ncbi:MAG TPA: PEP-CTERM sorting domain-containing protein [Opitutaceae bacterium]|nr:PEP-CTERM sorting domain-containing protein [Opitutaceae bacterium]